MTVPDRWIVIKMYSDSEKPVYKVLGGWNGGYSTGDAWRLNSGIVKAIVDGKSIVFSGYSGSKYQCYKESYGMNGIMTEVLNRIKNHAKYYNMKIRVLPEDSDFIKIDY